MKRERVVEDIMQKALRELPSVKRAYDIGLMEDSDRSGFDCSSDGIYLLDMTKLKTPSDWETNKSVMNDYGKKYSVPTLDVKRRLSAESVNEVTSFITSTPFVYEWNAEELRTTVPNEHIFQVLHQYVVLRVNIVLYICASEKAILYFVVIHVTDYFMSMD